MGAWARPVEKPRSITAPSTAKFLNESREISSSTCWNDSSCGKLWLYNLHYFDDLCGASSAEQSILQDRLILRWVEENPPALGNGWEPYPTSLRIVNWIKWAQAGNTLSESARQSLAVQVRWLAKRVEHHLLANHLFVNAKALVIAGMFFEGVEADRWLRHGVKILSREIPEQILSDGGHFERSPMYHAIILEDMFDLINAATLFRGCVPSKMIDHWKEVGLAMLEWKYLEHHRAKQI